MAAGGGRADHAGHLELQEPAMNRPNVRLSSRRRLLGAAYPQGLLRQSWEYLLQNHPHDSICGCSIDPVHEQMMTRFQWSTEIADGLTTEALHQLTRRAARPTLEEGDAAVRLFNPLPWPRDELVEATAYFPPDSTARAFEVRGADGNVLPCVVRRDEVKVRTVEHSDMKPAPRHPRSREVTLAFRAKLPATGYSTFTVRPLALPARIMPDRTLSAVEAGPTWIANEHLDVHVSYGHTYAMLNEPAIDPLGEARPNTQIFRELARRMGYGEACFADDDHVAVGHVVEDDAGLDDIVRRIGDAAEDALGGNGARQLAAGVEPLDLPGVPPRDAVLHEHHGGARPEERRARVGEGAEQVGLQRDEDEILPWDFLDHSVHKRFLWVERERAREERQTMPCDVTTCRVCGAC